MPPHVRPPVRQVAGVDVEHRHPPPLSVADLARRVQDMEVRMHAIDQLCQSQRQTCESLIMAVHSLQGMQSTQSTMIKDRQGDDDRRRERRSHMSKYEDDDEDFLEREEEEGKEEKRGGGGRRTKERKKKKEEEE